MRHSCAGIRWAVLVCALALGLSGCGGAGTDAGGNEGAAGFDNPLIEQRADPWVYKHTDGYYYFTGSVPEYDRIVLRRSETIEGLAEAEEVTVWRARESGEMSQHIWAPELHAIDGKWYIYFAAGQKDDIWRIRPYVLESSAANPLEGDWVEKGMMQAEDPGSGAFTDFSLDATTFVHGDIRYAVWAEKRYGISNLYIDKMVNPWTIEGRETMISTPEHAWEKIGFQVNEGAAVIKRNGKVFMTFSASATDDNYAIGLLTASEESDLTNPDSWTKSERPVMRSSEETGQYGPGHNSFTVTPDGKQDVIVYHARPYREIDGDPLYDSNRHTRAQILEWNEDGTPRFPVPAADAENQ
ncbi:glycoside hydrolase family 43 protein [Paenibacillus sp. TRM 82003]|nr:glycoside hydrolase family 43 protein [Paenibacillus sp. TRM 82003]